MRYFEERERTPAHVECLFVYSLFFGKNEVYGRLVTAFIDLLYTCLGKPWFFTLLIGCTWGASHWA